MTHAETEGAHPSPIESYLLPLYNHSRFFVNTSVLKRLVIARPLLSWSGDCSARIAATHPCYCKTQNVSKTHAKGLFFSEIITQKKADTVRLRQIDATTASLSALEMLRFPTSLAMIFYISHSTIKPCPCDNNVVLTDGCLHGSP